MHAEPRSTYIVAVPIAARRKTVYVGREAVTSGGDSPRRQQPPTLRASGGRCEAGMAAGT